MSSKIFKPEAFFAHGTCSQHRIAPLWTVAAAESFQQTGFCGVASKQLPWQQIFADGNIGTDLHRSDLSRRFCKVLGVVLARSVPLAFQSMMYVDGIAALWFLRTHRETVPTYPRCPFLSCAKHVRDISFKGLAKHGLIDKPLQLAVHADSERIAPSTFQYRVFANGLPGKPFLKVTDDLAIASPELCFAELSRYLTVPELIVLGFELDGDYVFSRTGEFGFRPKQIPIANAASTRRFLRRMPYTPGIRRAREATNWIEDESASPKETELGLRLYLPRRLGGYSLDGLKFNGAVRIGKIAAERIGIDTFHCDLLYARENVGLEYQSASFHLDRQTYAHDMQRMNAIQAAGTRIINVTEAQLSSFQQLDLIARDLSKALGRRYRKPTPAQMARKIDLLTALQRAERLVKALDSLDGDQWAVEDLLKLRSKVLDSEGNWLTSYIAIPELYVPPIST